MWPWTHSCASCCCCLNMETSGWRPRLNSHLDVEERPRLSQRPDEECQKCFTERRQKGSSCRGKEKTAVLGETFFTQSTSRCLWLCCSSSSPSSSFLLFLFLFPVQRAARESPEIPAAHKQDRTHTSTAQHCETTLPPPPISPPPPTVPHWRFLFSADLFVCGPVLSKERTLPVFTGAQKWKVQTNRTASTTTERLQVENKTTYRRVVVLQRRWKIRNAVCHFLGPKCLRTF